MVAEFRYRFSVRSFAVCNLNTSFAPSSAVAHAMLRGMQPITTGDAAFRAAIAGVVGIFGLGDAAQGGRSHGWRARRGQRGR